MPTDQQRAEAMRFLRRPATCDELADRLGIARIRAREILSSLRQRGEIEPAGVMVGKQNRWKRAKEASK